MLPSSLLTVYLFCEMAVHLRLLVFMKGYDIFFHTVPLVFFLKQSREKTSRRQNKQFVVNLFKMYLSLVCLASNHLGNFRVKRCQHACMKIYYKSGQTISKLRFGNRSDRELSHVIDICY